MAKLAQALSDAKEALRQASVVSEGECPEMSCLLQSMAARLDVCREAMPSLTEAQIKVVEEELSGHYREVKMQIARRERELEAEAGMLGPENDRVQGGESVPLALRIVAAKESDPILKRYYAEIAHIERAIATLEPWQKDFIGRYYVKRQSREEIVAEFSMSLPTFYRRRREIAEPLASVVFAGLIKVTP